MSAIEFVPWEKIPRRNRDIVVTEKLDGTNSAVLIVPLSTMDHIRHENGDTQLFQDDQRNLIARVAAPDGEQYCVFAQSRTRFIVPEIFEKGRENYGFAAWVEANAEALVETLGEGRHFGEWWGSGIQRGYGVKGKFFSLFNTSRWKDADLSAVPNLRVVPVLYWGKQSETAVQATLENLRNYGSVAATYEGFSGAEAEGIVIWHTAGRTFSKVTLKNDDAPKGPEAHAKDEERS